MISGIRFLPGLIDRSSLAVGELTLDIDEVAQLLASTSLSGLEPRTIARTEAAMQRAGRLAARAAGEGHQLGPALRRRSAMARAADGGSFPWAPLGWVNTMREETLKGYRELAEQEDKAFRDPVQAARLWKKEKWRQRRWPDGPRSMRVDYGRNMPARVTLLRGIDKQLQHINVERKIAEGVKQLDRFPLWRRAVIRVSKVGRHVPGFGDAIGIAGSLAEGDSLVDAVGKTVAGDLGAAAAVEEIGVPICGAVTVGSGGPGALSCPIILGVAAITGDTLGEAGYDKLKEQLVKSKKPSAVHLTPAKKNGTCKVSVVVPHPQARPLR